MTAITFTPLGEGVDMNNTIIVSFLVKSAKKEWISRSPFSSTSVMGGNCAAFLLRMLIEWQPPIQ